MTNNYLHSRTVLFIASILLLLTSHTIHTMVLGKRKSERIASPCCAECKNSLYTLRTIKSVPTEMLPCCNIAICSACSQRLHKKRPKRDPFAKECVSYKITSRPPKDAFFDIERQVFVSKFLAPLRFREHHHALSIRLLHTKDVPLLSTLDPVVDFSLLDARFSFKKAYEYPSKKFLAVIPRSLVHLALKKFSELDGSSIRLFLATNVNFANWMGAFWPVKNVIILSSDALTDQPWEQKLLTLLHELAHAFQAKIKIFDRMDDKFKENHADRTACLKMACYRCLKKVRQKVQPENGYFTHAEYDALIEYFKEKRQLCAYHTTCEEQKST